MFCVIKKSISLISPRILTVGQKISIKNNLINSIAARFYCTPRSEIDKWIETLTDSEKEKIRFIQNEITLQKLENKRVPVLERLTVPDYLFMMSISNNKRHKHYNFLHSVHCNQIADESKSKLKAELMKLYHQNNETGTEDSEKVLEYGLGKNSLFPKFYNKTLDAFQNRNVFRQMIVNGPKMVLDCGFDREMSSRENLETAKQLVQIFSNNRRHKVPFVLHFCNLYRENTLRRHLYNMIPTIEKAPVLLHGEDYTNVIPKENLVILTPDSPNILHEYNPRDCYVVSAIVDRGDMKPLSLSKAKKFELRTARLPLELYRSVRTNKVLTLDQIFDVMLEVKFSQDWDKAFQYVAARKFK